MAFALMVIGLFLLVSAARGKQDELFTLVKGDMTGPNNFVYWFTAILIIGAVGYIPKLKPVSVAMLTLVVIVLVLKKGQAGQGAGLFEKLTSGLKTTAKADQTPSLIVGPGHPVDTSPLGQLQPITGVIQ